MDKSNLIEELSKLGDQHLLVFETPDAPELESNTMIQPILQGTEM